MVIKTETGSVYEVANGRIRRLTGTHGPTARQGADGEWRPYGVLGGPTVGKPMLIGWSMDDGMLRSTVTSRVVEVAE